MLAPSQWSRLRLLFHVAIAIAVLVNFYQFFTFRETFYNAWPTFKEVAIPIPASLSSAPSSPTNDNGIAEKESQYSSVRLEVPCDSPQLKGLDDIFVILKTGANEARQRLPVHFNTTLRCLPHYGIWSDLEEDIEGYHVSNALDEMDPNVVAHHSDFDYYRRLQEGGLDAFTREDRIKWTNSANTAAGHDSPGWKLDKWKFLPLAAKAFSLRPQAKWFVFIEGDSFINWTNMLEWLSKIDATKPHYLGHRMVIGDVEFAYGGSGFAISNTAMRVVVEKRAANLTYYDNFTGKHWAGDCVLGKALLDAGVSLFQVWPSLYSENPVQMDFGEKPGPLWCNYAIAYHHMVPSDIEGLYRFEQGWNGENAIQNNYLRHSDVFRHFVLPILRPEVESWDNMSEKEHRDPMSYAECQAVCESQSDCVQFSLADGKNCKTSSIIKRGHQIDPNASGNETVVSGWIMDRVRGFVDKMDSSCENKDWIRP